jgi:small-conductance mechanosensitive channel
MDFSQPLEYQFLGNNLSYWAAAALIGFLTLIIPSLVRGVVRARRRKWREEKAGVSKALDLATLLISRTQRLCLLILAAYLGSRLLELPSGVNTTIGIIAIAAFWLQIGVWAVAAVRFWLEQRRTMQAAGDRALASSLSIVMFLTHLVVWGVVVVLALGNLGVNITALVAGLGIGGIAIALAVQTVLGDLLASLSIAFDKPFRVGDTLGIDDYTGVVEDIGVKSTRLRSLTGEQLIVSNADILKSRLRNLSRMSEQRAVIGLNIDYETPGPALERIKVIAEEAIAAQERTRMQHTILRNFGPTALEFEISYFVQQPHGEDFVRTVDAVNRAIHAGLSREGIRFAYPSRTAFQPPPGTRKAQPEHGVS